METKKPTINWKDLPLNKSLFSKASGLPIVNYPSSILDRVVYIVVPRKKPFKNR